LGISSIWLVLIWCSAIRLWFWVETANSVRSRQFKFKTFFFHFWGTKHTFFGKKFANLQISSFCVVSPKRIMYLYRTSYCRYMTNFKNQHKCLISKLLTHIVYKNWSFITVIHFLLIIICKKLFESLASLFSWNLIMRIQVS
jgi:hypothetical protein